MLSLSFFLSAFEYESIAFLFVCLFVSVNDNTGLVVLLRSFYNRSAFLSTATDSSRLGTATTTTTTRDRPNNVDKAINKPRSIRGWGLQL